MLTRPHLATKLTYWSNATAFVRPSHHPIPLGNEPTNTPRLALRWLQTRAAHIADQLDPAESRPALHWLEDHQEHEHALHLLTQGAAYRFTIYDDTTRYVLTARQVQLQGHRL
ncbi:hypothetical protein JGS22_010160 [Streptomyces sp. P38-E01]|uniref:Uncharacterized protein n=1 Tax=Streptomyces tardus TaxID=2780544 RepID=A0A949JKN7_9ACTN|nr:hypothetical protein [Streptomyces tardus]MBU7597969.1 hypothetical protein [Streptomyces tardus]